MITQTARPDFNTREAPPLHFLGLPTLVRATAQTTNGADRANPARIQGDR
jgi:hypothetical protein